MEKINVFLIFFTFTALRMVKTGILPMFKVIQDEVLVEKNDISEYLTFNASLVEAGTLDAILNLGIEVLKTLPENFHVLIKLERESSPGTYVSTGLNVDQPYCEFIKSDKLLQPLVTKFGNFASKCPIDAGQYHVKNVSLKGYQLPLAVPLGKYRGVFRYSIEDKEAVIVWKGQFVKA